MDIIWAPWRMKYIEYASLQKPRGCFICEAIRAEKPKDRLVLYKGRLSIVLMNLYPYNTGHLLVAPIRHVPDLENLDEKELTALFKAVKTSLKALRETLKPHGFNIGINLGRIAGAGLEDHVHVHIVPRWDGDTNFMPIIANTKVMPEALKDTYLRIMRKADLISEE